MDTSTEMEKALPPKTTYYNRFPKRPRLNSNLVHVFWAVARDYRRISINERRNVVYPAKRAGLMDSAPPNERGIPLNKNGETSCTGFVLTEEGERYFKECIQPLLSQGFASESPCLPARKNRKTDPDPRELKGLGQ